MTDKFLIVSYALKDLTMHVERGDLSWFDHGLRGTWNQKCIVNSFKHTEDHLTTRCISGKYGFIAQFNIEWVIDQKEPKFVTDVLMPFDGEKFNFGKARAKILLILEPDHWEQTSEEKTSEKKEPDHCLVLLNVSPIEFCDSFIFPCMENCHPQVLHFDALRLALETVALSLSPALLLGMNSLGAYASVNHLYFQIYYLQQTLYLQHSKVKEFMGDCYEIDDFPSKGFAFQLSEVEQLIPIARSVMKLINFLQEERIDHNVFISRGRAFADCSGNEEIFNAIRIFVWARKSCSGIKNDITFNPTAFELAGHLPIKEKKIFENVTEEEVAKVLEDVCSEVYTNIKERVRSLYV